MYHSISNFLYIGVLSFSCYLNIYIFWYIFVIVVVLGLWRLFLSEFFCFSEPSSPHPTSSASPAVLCGQFGPMLRRAPLFCGWLLFSCYFLAVAVCAVLAHFLPAWNVGPIGVCLFELRAGWPRPAAYSWVGLELGSAGGTLLEIYVRLSYG